MTGPAKALGSNRFPQHSHVVLSGFPPFPQIEHVLIDFATALSRSAARNRISALVANDGAPSNTEETGNFRLRFPLPGVLLHLAIPLRSVLCASVFGGPIGGTPASRPRQRR